MTAPSREGNTEMNPGDHINLKDGRKAVVTRTGLSDFIGDPFPIYYVVIGTTETGFLMSDELKKRKHRNDR